MVSGKSTVEARCGSSLGHQSNVTRWSRGDTYRVQLDIDAQADMTWVVVNDPVPAGATILGSGLGNLIFFMVISQWVQYARLVRGSVLTLREREFVQAAAAIGVRDRRIILDHLLPNVLGPIIILMTLNVANNILLESSLTFLGLGVDPLVPSWGGMLADGRTYLQTAWWISVFPGLAIMLTVLGLNLLGDWLRDLLDPTGKI